MGSKDLYSILGVSRKADQATIQAAYRTLMRRYHPDARLESDTARAQQINEAYEVLGDPEKRRQYDALSHSKRAAKAPGSSSQHATKKKIKRENPLRSKRWLQRRGPSISDAPAEWWIIAFVTALAAFLYLARR